ncbi:MAG: hypothetical protein ACI93H_000440, partial [Psychromonas sp.]
MEWVINMMIYAHDTSRCTASKVENQRCTNR